MKVFCKLPVADYGGNILFHGGVEYPVVKEAKYKNGVEYLMVKDENGCLRELFMKDKEYKQHFKVIKEEHDEQ
ncbi:hypothetical protein [Paenibacillus illinoisensis]|uniref:hypothetical protein n=1 Tax=Paenibacillus illinoisensis TaxID=59845 RepID=UPI00301AF051